MDIMDGYLSFPSQDKKEEYRRDAEFMDALGIPVNKAGISSGIRPTVYASTLVDILSDEFKLKELLQKLKLKAFW